MFGGILITTLAGFVSFLLIDQLKRQYPFVNAPLLKRLYFYHILLTLAYYIYALFNPSDSKAYYQKVLTDFRGQTWEDFYGTSTKFIEFIGYPMVKYFGFSYEATMAVFSFFGFLGFIFFYIFFKENIHFKHRFLGFDLLTLIFFLPNLHFWSSSFGKGSVIFFGLGLFFYGISRLRTRILAVIIGSLIIYHVRPHIMLVILVSSVIGFMFSTRGIGLGWRLLFLAGASVAFFFIYQDVLTMVGIDDEAFLSEGLDLTHRASELTKATSGVDIINYSLPMQVFTFLYRPLFVDAPGVLGLIVSVENVFYLLVSAMLFVNVRAIRFMVFGSFLTKTAFISFMTVTVALAQISGNLGLAMRQKSQVMILLMFVVISFLDHEKLRNYKAVVLRRRHQHQTPQNAVVDNGTK